MNLSQQALTLLRVSSGRDFLDSPYRLEVDEYVPLQCFMYREPLGAGYLRLGNYSTTLMELAIEPWAQVLRGVTITLIDEMSPWPEFVTIDVIDELPVLSTSFEGGETVSLPEKFKVAARSGEVIVFWDEIARCTGYRCGGVSFLTVDHVLAGAWFTGLSEQETNLFASHGSQDHK